MTAEIAIMNRHAVVLAADSATTVTTWIDGKQERRYFKGANKLFELSRSEPIGLMIYGSASIQGVPWELAVKSFREHLGTETHDSLTAYSEHFFDFVEHHDKLFSSEQKQKSLINAIGAASKRLEARILSKLDTTRDDQSTIAPQVFENALVEVIAEVKALSLPPLIKETDISTAATVLLDDFCTAVRSNVVLFATNPEREPFLRSFTETLISLGVKEFCTYADRTGVVVAGYGKDEFYPSLDVFECYGFLGDRLLFARKDNDCHIMSPNAEAIVQPFATTSMIDTFRFGVAPDAFGAVFESTVESLKTFANSVMNECGCPGAIDDARLAAMADAARNDHTDAWFFKTRNQHFTPLSNVIHSLPIPDMAGLAKSLIELESLKERVTKPSESVSGPIDVAVISKFDGFVWIDRKHYFKPDLNPRYLKRFK